MVKYTVKMNWKKLKQIPKIIIVIWLLLGVISIYCFFQILLPTYSLLDNLQEYEIDIDKVQLIDSYNTTGRRMKLKITSEGQTFYVWYPIYRDYSKAVEDDLLSGMVNSVTVKVVDKPTVRDLILDQKRVVDIRSDKSVYYDVDTERAELQKDKASVWIIFLWLFPIWIFGTFLVLLIYDVLALKK